MGGCFGTPTPQFGLVEQICSEKERLVTVQMPDLLVQLALDLGIMLLGKRKMPVRYLG